MCFDYEDIFDSYSDISSGVTAGSIAAVNIVSSLIGLAACVLMIIALWKLFEKAGKPGWHALIPFLNVYDIFQIGWKRKVGIATIITMACGGAVMFIGVIVLAAGYGGGYFNLLYGGDSLRALDNLTGAALLGVAMIGLGGIALGVSAILTLVAYIKLAQAFGKSGGFLVGMFFLPAIFLCILAFGQARYIGSWNREGYQPDPYGGNGTGANPYGGQAPYQGGQPYGGQAPNQGGQPYGGQAPYQGGQAPYGAPAGNPNPQAQGAAPINNGEIPEPPRYCSGCGTQIQPGAKFCAACGKQFGQ